jgi:hypothetical protein
MEEEYPEPAWLFFVRAVGKELRTLKIPDEECCTMREVPEEIWGLCPKLEDFFPYMLLLKTSPPAGHPIHTITVGSYGITNEEDLQESLPDWPGLRTIRINESWDTCMARFRAPLKSSHLQWFASRCLALEDERGEPYAEYMSRFESKQSSSI